MGRFTSALRIGLGYLWRADTNLPRAIGLLTTLILYGLICGLTSNSYGATIWQPIGLFPALIAGFVLVELIVWMHNSFRKEKNVK